MKTRITTPLLATLILALAPMAQAQISVSVDINMAPPDLPVYVQPAIPGDGYMWTPGYWAWNGNDQDYYWVPGTWVNVPYAGALWTPGYWEYDGNQYQWNRGYWGNHIGYYGGINYGYGYAGVGYQGGYWERGSFNYNRSVNNVSNVRVSNVYDARVTNIQNSHVSFNGGRGGVPMTATKSEQIINSMPHNQPTPQQVRHETAANAEHDQRLSVNHGSPRVAATPEAGAFNSSHNEATGPEQVTSRQAALRAPSRPADAQQEQARQPQERAPQQSQQRAPQSYQQLQPRQAPAPRPENHSTPVGEEQHR